MKPPIFHKSYRESSANKAKADRLEKFTLAAMQGLLCSPNFNYESDSPEFISRLALKMAKAHIEAIDNNNKQGDL
jgi:hypothetical protein